MTGTEGWREVKLGDLLTDEQCVQVGKLIGEKNTAELLAYLKRLKEQLESKGVLPEYLYYVLVHEFYGKEV